MPAKKAATKAKTPALTGTEYDAFYAYYRARLDGLSHELAHARNAIRTHTDGLQRAQVLHDACLYRIDELEQLHKGLGLTPAPDSEAPPDVEEAEDSQTPGSQEDH